MEADLSRLPGRALTAGGCHERAAQDVSGQGRRSGDHHQLVSAQRMTEMMPDADGSSNRLELKSRLAVG
jgi:hypothetical protein